MELREAIPGTCLALAYERLEDRAITDSTYKNYLRTLRALEIEDLPVKEATVRNLSKRLNTILTVSTRRQHSVNLQATLGIKVPTAKPTQKLYDLPEIKEVHEAFANNRYRIYAFSMLYAGMRLGEACVKQKVSGNTITVYRQRTPQTTITPPKTSGPVVVPAWFADEYREAVIDKAPPTIYQGIKRGGKKFGLDLNPHQLRHMFATNLVNMGASPNILQKQMRHHDVKVSLTYYVQTRESDIQGFMDRFGQ
ncbi:tyrosine-type recombinase/integrase [Streptomyces microflavus]